MKAPGEPDSLLLRPSLRQWWWVILTALAFAAIGVWMLRDGGWKGWFVLGVFGFGAMIGIAQVLPGASYLRLTREGFEVKAFWRRAFHRWADVSDFHVAEIGGKHLVAWTWAPGVRLGRGTALSRALSGVEAALGDRYGRAPDDLVRIMNAWRARAVAAPPG